MADAPKKTRRLVEGLAPARKPAEVDSSTTSRAPFKIGHGYDIHQLKTGGKLVLGGVTVSSEMSPIAYSDGDVVIHAIVDALLGAMGWGDIGEHYSDKDPALKGADSSLFLRQTFDRVANAGYSVGNVDVTILAEKPRISPFKQQMAKRLAELLGGRADVNIKAGTNEQCDAVGRGEAIAAHAVALLTLG